MANLKDFLKTNPEFIASYVSIDTIPYFGKSEVAFIGRSNVGKSSLINAICQVNKLAKTSSTPGRTQLINMFNWDDRIILTDLPGYGFAKAPKKIVDKWNENTNTYLKGRAELRRVFLLIDARHGIKKSDIDMMKMLDEAAVNYQTVLTKMDKVGKNELQRKIDGVKEIYQDHPAMFEEILTTSAEKKMGIDEIRKVIWSIIQT